MSSPGIAAEKYGSLAGDLGSKALTTRVYTTIEAVEPIWRHLEHHGAHTAYQRLDWIKAYLKAGFAPRDELAIIVVSENGVPIALAPFAIRSRLGLRMANLVGMPISNGDALLFDPQHADRLTSTVLREAFAEVRADLITFHCVTGTVAGGLPNPLLAFPHRPAPDNFYANELAPGDTPYIDQSLPHKRRTNIKRSQRRLREAFGDVCLREAQSEADVDAMLAVFLDQRGKRFELMGVENIFAKPEFRSLFRELAVSGLGSERPALRIHGLYAGERLVATTLGAYTQTHYSQYINSTDYGDASRYSLMGTTMSLLVEELRQQGVTSLDMGLGDFDYKLDWTRKVEVYDIVIGNSSLGKAAAPLLLSARSLKRTIKQTPRLWKAARALQSLINGLRRS